MPAQASSEPRTRLAMIGQYVPRSGGYIFMWIGQAMANRGMHVGVLTGATQGLHGDEETGGKAWMRESVDGIPVLRVPWYRSHDRSAVRRAATFLSFATSGAVLGTRDLGKADVCLVYASPATAAVPAMVARRLHGTPFVLLIQDVWPDSVFATGFLDSPTVKSQAWRLLELFVNLSYSMAAHIVVISPGMRDLLVERGVPQDKVTVTYNWVDETVLRPEPENGRMRSALGLAQTDVLFLHAGNQGEAQGLGPWIEAMGRLRGVPEAHLVLLGSGTHTDMLRRQSAELGLAERVHHVDPVSLSEVAEFCADADVMVVSLKEDPLFHVTLPSKTQSALAQAKPVIVSAPGDAAQIIVEAGAGWIACPDDPVSIADAIAAAVAAGPDDRRARGQAGLDHYRRTMSAEVGAARLETILAAAVADSGIRP